MPKNEYTPEIFVRTLKDYYGEWFEVNDDLQENIKELLETRNAEEIAIHDYKEFGYYSPDEHMDLDDLVIIAELIQTHGYAASWWLEEEDRFCYGVTDYPTLEEEFLDAFEGVWESKTEYAYQMLLANGIEEDSFAYRYFDWESFIRDQECKKYLIQHKNEIYVFNC